MSVFSSKEFLQTSAATEFIMLITNGFTNKLNKTSMAKSIISSLAAQAM